MTSSVFVCFLFVSWTCRLALGEVVEESNAVVGLQELTRDILARIKLATGQPIDTNRFYPILSASSKNYELIHHHPYSKTTKYATASKNNKIDGGHFHSNKGDLNSGRGKDHYHEVKEEEKKGKEQEKHKYEDQLGKQTKYSEERYYKKNHHKSNAGKKGGKSKKGRKRGKFHLEKGFRDIYHKDEEKKADFYWNNQHEEGKWIEYGFTNRKTEKSNDKGDEGKKSKGKKEESSYEKKEDKCTKCKT